MRINCLTRGKEEENEFHLSFHSFTLFHFPRRERERRYVHDTESDGGVYVY